MDFRGLAEGANEDRVAYALTAATVISQVYISTLRRLDLKSGGTAEIFVFSSRA